MTNSRCYFSRLRFKQQRTFPVQSKQFDFTVAPQRSDIIISSLIIQRTFWFQIYMIQLFWLVWLRVDFQFRDCMPVELAMSNHYSWIRDPCEITFSRMIQRHSIIEKSLQVIWMVDTSFQILETFVILAFHCNADTPVIGVFEKSLKRLRKLVGRRF